MAKGGQEASDLFRFLSKEQIKEAMEPPIKKVIELVPKMKHAEKFLLDIELAWKMKQEDKSKMSSRERIEFKALSTSAAAELSVIRESLKELKDILNEEEHKEILEHAIGKECVAKLCDALAESTCQSQHMCEDNYGKIGIATNYQNIVMDVAEKSPAALAGIQVGDTIQSIDGMATSHDVVPRIMGPVGSNVTLTLWRTQLQTPPTIFTVTIRRGLKVW